MEAPVVTGDGNKVDNKSTFGLVNIDLKTAAAGAAGAAGYAILGHPVRRAAYRIGGIVLGEWIIGWFKKRKIKTTNGIVTKQ